MELLLFVLGLYRRHSVRFTI
jgi:hypothetical protein